MTWMKTYRQYREARSLGIKSPLAIRLIHDGTVYFLILLVLNISQIVSFFFADVSIVNSFANAMSPILVCRFMMNLRLVNRGGPTTSEASSSQQLASLRMPTFNDGTAPSFMTNMGEPLYYDQNDMGDDDVQDSNE
ncbi:uncharacterized protein PHACADRAFT_206502 [Phanerochaete carnosa HHB-10118-sp]|uniref:Uncharacterized protein n=1 Tax=Phanerochaete carnosa (strain HHB-10118-sp) TaxID=650164 RepID=K5V4Q7_PHACS|nr:uncharacterized protein PHACADRAFT_206502 [Phanerochaete carnosa HHB-10118-sp]EKM57611.1 hypothetical protein PHACADRAFT_206502 [Phanerochaete carnosa HHB-10118-sp]